MKSFSSTDPRLRSKAPKSLRRVSGVRHPFDRARDPFIKKQWEALKKTEAQRREESGGGPHRVKLHSPLSLLKPEREPSRFRQAFNNDFLRMKRESQISFYRKQEAKQESEHIQDQASRQFDTRSTVQDRECRRGSNMIKRDKPFPDLRPKRDLSQIRKTFNDNWLKERREAEMHNYQNQAESLKDSRDIREKAQSFPKHDMER